MTESAVLEDSGRPYLPSYQDVMQTYEYEDSMRLPTYRFRQLGRYHPYLRFTPAVEDMPARYMNTVYDEARIVLNIPPLGGAPLQGPTFDEDNVEFHNPHDETESGNRRDLEFQQRITRLSGVIDDFVAGLKQAIQVSEDNSVVLSDQQTLSPTTESASPVNGTDTSH